MVSAWVCAKVFPLGCLLVGSLGRILGLLTTVDIKVNSKDGHSGDC